MTYIDDGGVMSTYLSDLGTLLHTRITELADFVRFHVELWFKASLSAKCSQESLRS